MTEEAAGTNEDFSLEDEYKEDPLCATGQYFGNVLAVVNNFEAGCIEWKVCLANNGGLMSDGETEVDGSHHFYRNWMPQKGDDKVMSKDGKKTKRQSKINMLKDSAEQLKVNMDSPAIINEAIDDGIWIGLAVICKISIDTYEDRTRNQIDRMFRNPDETE